MNRKKYDVYGGIISYIFLLLACIFALVPIIWFLVTSFKNYSDIISFPPTWIPKPIVLYNYITVALTPNVVKYFFNSMIVSSSTILITIILASYIAYATSRIKFKYSNIILFGILATSMIPGICILPALYVMSIQLNLYDTYLVLVLVLSAWQIPIITWVMKGFFDSLPKEIEEAAMIDGCSRLQAFYRVVVPLCQPGLAASAILVFIYVWNDWLIASTLTISLGMRTVNVGLYNYVTDLGIQWGRFSAYTIFSIIPVIVLFIFLQSRFIEGLTAGAQKG